MYKQVRGQYNENRELYSKSIYKIKTGLKMVNYNKLYYNVSTLWKNIGNLELPAISVSEKIKEFLGNFVDTPRKEFFFKFFL